MVPTTKKVIATSNPNIDIPKVIDEAECLPFSECFTKWDSKDAFDFNELFAIDCFKKGYKKSKETYPFNEDDIKSFATHFYTKRLQNIEESIDNSFQIWKQQRIKTLYYQ